MSMGTRPGYESTIPASLGGDLVFGLDEVVGGTYEIRRLIGQGGMGQVFEAYDRGLHRVVAIKAPRRTSSKREAEHGLHREAEALAAFHHPGLVAAYALGEHRGTPFLVMERVHGVSLEAHLS